MSNTEQFPFTSFDTRLGEAGFRAYMPIQLINQQLTVTSSALLDTGATVNVLPYPVGLELGYILGTSDSNFGFDRKFSSV